MSPFHSDRGRRGVAAGRAIVLATAGSVAIGLAVPATPVAARTKSKSSAVAHKKKHKKKHVKTSVVMPARAVTPAACAAAPAAPGIIDGTLGPLIAHLESAHLETSPGDQLAALLLTPDQYVQLHTVLVEAMLTPTLTSADQLSGVVENVLTPLLQHIDSAHLETSPVDQLKALVGDPDSYTLLHTVLAEHAAQPVIDYVTALLGVAGISCGAAATPAMSMAPAAGAAPAPAPAAAAAKALAIEGFMFAPAATTVTAGTTVTWTNHDAVAHTVTSTAGGPLKSPSVAPGKSFSYTFATPGTYAYVCAIHPNMKGTVTVQ